MNVALVKPGEAPSRPLRTQVSVCIANYQGTGVLPECLDSVFAQDFGGALQVIVHDDASTDGSIALLREHYPDVEVIASEDNVGFCRANNRMVDRARGEYILLLNNDAALQPGAIAALLEAARESATSPILTLPQYDWESGVLVDRGCRLDVFHNPVPNLDPERRDVAMAIGACLWIHRTLWTQLGGFPEWLESIGEDLFLCCAARLRGVPVRVVKESGYRHRQGYTFGGGRPTRGRLASTYRRRSLSERNKTFVLVIMTPTAFVWPLLAVHLLAVLIEGCVLSLIKRDRRLLREVYIYSLTECWRERWRLVGERRRQQNARCTSFADYVRQFTLVPRKLVLLMRYGIPGLS